MKKDWVGEWYNLSRERGGNDIANMAHVNLETAEVHWHNFSHAQYDGLGGVAQFLRRQGVPVKDLPQTKFKKAPAWWKRPGILWRALHGQKSPKFQWKTWRPQLKAGANELAWLVLSLEETQELQHLVQEQGISQNAWLLAQLNQLIVGELAVAGAQGQWMFPVNMRGAVDNGVDTANHSSAIALLTHAHSSASEIAAQISRKLKRAEHWGNWWVFNSGRLLGRKAMKHFSQQAEKKSFWFGTFSNMGEWQIQEHLPWQHPCALILAPPGSANYPVGMVLFTWRGRLALSLKIHPSIGGNKDLAQAYLKQLRQKMLKK